MKINYFFISLFAFTLLACEDSHSDPNPPVPEVVKPTPVEPNDPDIPSDPDLDPTTDFEWDTYPVSVKIPEGKKWRLHSQSDEFKMDDGPYDTKVDNLGGKWTNFYHADWRGPAPTYWQFDHVWIEDGYMKIKTTRPQEAKEMIMNVEHDGGVRELPATFTACVSSEAVVGLQTYIEARVKIANATMASNVWLLSPDDTQEIDFWEAYGSDRITGDGGYDFSFCGPDRLHLSHHMFIRDPFQDYQPLMPETWHRSDEGTLWRDDFHTVGVYRRDAWNLEYYVDGKLVRVVQKDLIDPLGYNPTGGGLDQDLDIIINMEDHSWRAYRGMSPTDEELENQENSTMLIDWIRIYELVDDVPVP